MFAALGRVIIVAGIIVAFILGLAGAVYLSLRSSEVTVPNVVGRHYLQGEEALEDAQLNIRKRAKRFKDDAPPDTILDQSPRPGEVVKVGQTIAVIVSDEESGKNARPNGEQPQEAQATPTPQVGGTVNENQERQNRNANRNANKRANKNANNANANNANNRNANNTSGANNANNRNRNLNQNRNANTNRPGNTNAGRPNANNRNSTLIINRPNSNAGRQNSNANRRPSP